MKKLNSLFVVAMLCCVAFVFSSCSNNPTFGLKEVTIEELLKADLCDTYEVKTEATNYVNGTEAKETSTEKATEAEVKEAFAGISVAMAVANAIVPGTIEVTVYANKSWKKIVCYTTQRENGEKVSDVTLILTKK